MKFKKDNKLPNTKNTRKKNGDSNGSSGGKKPKRNNNNSKKESVQNEVSAWKNYFHSFKNSVVEN